MSDARFQRVNEFSNNSLRLMSKQCTSDVVVAGRKTSHHASHTSAQPAASFRTSGGRTGCFRDSSGTFPDQTGPGGRSKVLARITEDDGTKTKKPKVGQFASETLAKNATTKTISFLASPKKSSLRGIKIKKTGAYKKPNKSPYKEKVTTRIRKPYWQNPSNGKLESNKQTFKHVRVYKSPIHNQSVSSKLSEPIRAIAQKSRSGATPPHQSRKRMSVTSQAAGTKWPQGKVKRSISIKRRTYLHPVSPSKVVKTQSSQNCYFVSFSVSPQKVFCQTNDTTTSPQLDEIGRCASLPHRCVGYENLFTANRKTKSNGSLNKRQASSKQKLKSKSRGKMKVQGSEEVSGYRGQSRYSPGKRSEAVSVKDCGLVTTGQPRDSQVVGSRKLSIRSVPCETHSIQNIFRNSALIFLGDDKKSKKAHKETTAKPKIKLFSRNKVEGSREQSDFGHFIYRQKMPSVNHYTPLRPKCSKNCAFTESSSQLTSAGKRGDDKNEIKNTITSMIPRSAVTKNRILSKRPTDESCVKRKLIYKKARTGILRPLHQKTLNTKDKSKLTVTNADSKKANKDSEPGRHINILKKQPQRTICHYRNKDKHIRYPDSCSSSDMNLPNSEINKRIPETPSPEMAAYAIQNVYSKKIWDRYDNSQESMSSFFRQVSTCDSSARTQQMSLLKGTFRLPSGTVSCSEENCSIFHEPYLRKTQMCIPSLTDDPSIPPTHGSCCAMALLPSLFGFLNCINKTLSVPLFNRTSCNTDTYPNSPESQPVSCTLDGLLITNDDKLSEMQGRSLSQEESNYIIHEMGETQICAGDRREKVVESTLVGDKSMADLQIELNKTPQVKDQDSNLSLSLLEHSRTARRRTTKKPLSMSSQTDVVKTILHIGNISTRKTQEYGRKKNVQTPPKENVLEEKYFYCRSEESEIKNKDSATVVKWDSNWKLLILGMICFTVVVQVILYYLIHRR